MPTHHPFIKDATFTVLYIGAMSALVAVTLTLAVLMGLGAEFSHEHWTAALASAAGWLAMPFAPRLYRSKTGHGFLSDEAIGRPEA